MSALTTTQRNFHQLNQQENNKYNSQQNNQIITNQLLSPCPDVFSYISVNNTSNGWTGVLHLTTAVPLYGIYIDIIFDRHVSLVVVS